MSWLDGGSTKALALHLNTALAGETVEVLIWISNPLALELELSRLRLIFEPEPMPADGDLTPIAEACDDRP
jgi:hypothetical protein